MSSSMDGPSSSWNSRPSSLIKPVPTPAWQYGYPVPEQRISSPVAYNMVSNAHGFSYSRFGNDTYDAIPEIGWDRGDFEDKDNRPYMIRWKSGKKVDQRLLMMLESFYQELYVKRKDFFHKIFPGTHDQLEEVFGKIDVMLSKNNNKMKHQTLQRSLSVGSPRRPQRFKVKTPAVIIGNPPGGKGGGGATGSW